MRCRMFSEELNKARQYIRQFLAERPHVSRLQLSKRTGLHRNTLYGASDRWSSETIDKILKAMADIKTEEAKAQRKTRPSLSQAA